jgi:hypothetical protein
VEEEEEEEEEEASKCSSTRKLIFLQAISNSSTRPLY